MANPERIFPPELALGGTNIWVYHAAGGLILEAAMTRFLETF